MENWILIDPVRNRAPFLKIDSLNAAYANRNASLNFFIVMKNLGQ